MMMTFAGSSTIFVDGFVPSSSQRIGGETAGSSSSSTTTTSTMSDGGRFVFEGNQGARIGSTTTTTTTRLSKTVLQSSLLASAGVALDAFWRNFPYAAAAIVCGIKASGADYVAQRRQKMKKRQEEGQPYDDDDDKEKKIEELELGIQIDDVDKVGVSNDVGSSMNVVQKVKKEKIKNNKFDIQRNLAYIMYGSLYQGMSQEYIYNHLYPLFFGIGTDITTVLVKVGFDLFVQTTLLTLPIAYMTKAVIYQYSFREAWKRYFDDVKNHGLLTKYFSLWGPVQCMTFSIIPEHFRVTFIAFVSFFWLIILSTIASRTDKTK